MHPPTHLHNDSTTHVLREHIELTLLTEMKRLYAAGTIDMPRMRAIARHTVAEIKTGANMSELMHALSTYANAFPEMLSAIKTLLNEYEDETRAKALAQTTAELHQILSSTHEA